MTQDDDVIGAADAAALLNMSRSQLGRLVRRGELVPIVKLQGRTGAYMFGRATVLEFQKARERVPRQHRRKSASSETRAAS